MVENGFSQLVTEPTKQSNILDLVLCNEALLVSDVNVLSPIGGSDHASIQFKVITNYDRPTGSNPSANEHAETQCTVYTYGNMLITLLCVTTYCQLTGILFCVNVQFNG